MPFINKMMKFTISSRDKNSFIHFKNIKKESGFDSVPQKFLDVDIEVKVNEVSINTRASYELTDLMRFISDMDKMQRGVFKAFFFQQLDENFILKFMIVENGIIDIHGRHTNSDYSVASNFKIEIDQSYLSNLILQVDEIVQNLVGKA